MAFKAIKVVKIGDKTFNPGDIIKEDVDVRLIRSKKVEIVDEPKIKEEKPKKPKEQKEELLIEDSSEVSVETQEAGE